MMKLDQSVKKEESVLLPKVSIIILNWNGLKDTIECLESLKEITYPNQYKIIVVDNGSERNEAEILAKRYRDWIHIIRNDRNYGFVEGNNIGIEYALEIFNPDYVLILNNDVVVHPQFLIELVKNCENERDIGIAQPKIYFYDEPSKIQSVGAQIRWWRGRTPLMGWGEIDIGQYNEVKEIDYASGAAMLIKKEVIEKVRFNSEYFINFEDTQLCTSARKIGYKIVYIPYSQVWHKLGNATIKKKQVSSIFMYYSTRNRFLFMRKNASKFQFIIFVISFFLMEFLRMSASFVISRNLNSLKLFYKAIYHGINLKGGEIE